MQPLRAKVHRGPMAVKVYFAFPKAPVYWSLAIRLFNVISRELGSGSYLSAEIQSVYSTVSSNWAGLKKGILPSRLELTTSLQRSKTPLTSVLDITLSNLMVRFQWCWSFDECGVVILHCHCSQVHSGPEWSYLIGFYVLGLNWIVWNRTDNLYKNGFGIK